MLHLPRLAVSKGLIVDKSKRDLKYMVHVYFEPVRPQIIYLALAYQKSLNKSYKDISITKGFSSGATLKFSDIVGIQGENGV